MLAQVAVGVKTVRASVIRSSANDDTGMSGEGEMSSQAVAVRPLIIAQIKRTNWRT